MKICTEIKILTQQIIDVIEITLKIVSMLMLSKDTLECQQLAVTDYIYDLPLIHIKCHKYDQVHFQFLLELTLTSFGGGTSILILDMFKSFPF